MTISYTVGDKSLIPNTEMKCDLYRKKRLRVEGVDIYFFVLETISTLKSIMMLLDNYKHDKSSSL